MSTRLTPARRDLLAQVLRQRQQALATQLQAREQGGSAAEQALAAREQDGDDALQLASDNEIESARTGIEHRELAALGAALQRVHEAEYGLCADCGKAIPFERLFIEPQALRCVACESVREKKEAA